MCNKTVTGYIFYHTSKILQRRKLENSIFSMKKNPFDFCEWRLIFLILSLIPKKTPYVTATRTFISHSLPVGCTCFPVHWKIRNSKYTLYSLCSEWLYRSFLKIILISAAFQQMCVMFEVYVWNVLRQLQCRPAVSCAIPWFQRHDCITLPIRFLRPGDRIDRRLTGSMTVLTVRVFCSWA